MLDLIKERLFLMRNSLDDENDDRHFPDHILNFNN